MNDLVNRLNALRATLDRDVIRDFPPTPSDTEMLAQVSVRLRELAGEAEGILRDSFRDAAAQKKEVRDARADLIKNYAKRLADEALSRVRR